MRRRTIFGSAWKQWIGVLLAAVAGVSCDYGNATTPTAPSAPIVTTRTPAWVAASFTGGATQPNDRKGHPTDDWNGRLCNASSGYPFLDNWGRVSRSLTIIMTCLVSSDQSLLENSAG